MWACTGSFGGSPASCFANRVEVINGACGAANGMYAATATSFGGPACVSGSAVPASPPFPPAGGTTTWECRGTNGGSTAPCGATRAQTPQDAVCGPAARAYVAADTSFSGPLCSNGTATPGTPPFPAQGASTSWTCVSSTGGQNSPPCTATRSAPINGTCGPAHANYTAAASAFAGDFCLAGALWPSSPPFPPAGGAVTWECRGVEGGSTAPCRANRAENPQNASCGPAAQDYAVGVSNFSGSFCNPGSVMTPPTFPAAGASVTWTCQGLFGGASATCSARASQHGQCGAAATAYAAGDSMFAGTFCAIGTASNTPAFPASGSSTSWTCSGFALGNQATCVASRGAAPITGQCGSAAAFYPSSASSFGGAAFCVSGTASPSSVPFPPAGGTSTWDCVGANGGTSELGCAATRQNLPVDGECGPAHTIYTPSANAFMGPLCNRGVASPSAPAFPAPGATTSWTCQGQFNGTSASCSATRQQAIDGVCGAAHTTYPSTATTFAGAFCATGSPTPTSPAFPSIGGATTWTCSGTNGGSAVPCSAQRSLPLPTCNFSLERTSGSSGVPFKLTWDSDATTCSYRASVNGVPGAWVNVGCSGISSSNFPSLPVGGTVSWTLNANGTNGTSTCSATYTATSAQPNAAPCYVTVMPRTVTANAPLLIFWSSPNSSCSFTHNTGPAAPIGCQGDLNNAGSWWGLGANVVRFMPTPQQSQTASTCEVDFTVTP